MLILKNIKKIYRVGEIETRALDDISLAFPQKEFVAILGMSGSGKTTCLNIIGGLDRYDSGELIIKGKKTSDFSDKDWDAYRNNSVGFVFQNYNLISHLGIVDNVALGMTLSGISAKDKKRRALEVLEQVGLKEHTHKKPNQLSGGQMQRVAIARALANNPEILLCDEPTGALDTTTSRQIMDLIKKISLERLVIVVTHNPDIAQHYADRIIRFSDGKIVSDSKPYHGSDKPELFSLKKTSMSFFTALKLSFNNIRTKKGRTFLTGLASSIGIIGIAIILSLSSGFQQQIDVFQSDTMGEFPILIAQSTTELNAENIASMRESMEGRIKGTDEYAQSDEVYLYDPSETTFLHTNVFTSEYLQYLEAIDPDICSGIGYVRIVSLNMLREIDGRIVPASLSATPAAGGDGMSHMASMEGAGMSSYPVKLRQGDESYLVENYELLSGSYPQKATDLVLVIDSRNRIDLKKLQSLGFDVDGKEAIKFSHIVGTEFGLVSNNDYYHKTDFGTFLPSRDYEAMYNSGQTVMITITGIVRPSQDSSVALLSSGIAYSDELARMVIDKATDSEIVRAQQASDINVITMQELNEDQKASMLAFLGGSATPYMMMVYPLDFEAKDAITGYLDAFNENKPLKEQVIYTDLAKTISDLSGSIMNGITIVLVAFASISLIVSLIMIGIITYTSVLERTKEIGILRALGARKKDITRVFDAETCLLGVFSGLLGIAIAWLLTKPINIILYNLTDLENISRLQLEHALILVALSTVLTVIGGHIPAIMASNKQAVDALRSE